ncbi:hypothetical protein [Stagnihabitans tardus]|uniref:Uncharacterized protein n=1 Tax=Stagnihabitans tardus TaxID=2699202 RepID=A0AAE4Y794_9RHOB|nr:hypothetical protein [Stagnihabitans tardus]NBZ86439.1 hypothetical protein [Stagnihabitans tardus]
MSTVNGTIAGPNVSFVGNYIDNGLLRIDAKVISGDPAFPGANPAAIFVANHFHKNGNGGNPWLIEFFNGNASNLSGAVIANNTFTTVNEAVHFTGTYVPDDQKRWVVSGNISGDGSQVVGLPDVSIRGAIIADGHVSIRADKSVSIMADWTNDGPASDSIISLGTNGTEYHRVLDIGWWGFGVGQASGGGNIAALGWNGSNFLINPSNGAGGVDNTRQFTYDLSKTAWQFKAPLILAALADVSDATKRASFALGGIASGTQVTISLPDASGTMLLEGQPIGATTPASVKGSSLTSTGLVTSGTSFLGALAPGDLGFGAKEFVFVTPTASGTFTTTVPPAGTRCTLVITAQGTTSRNLSFGAGFVGAGVLATGTTPGKKFILNFVSDGQALYESNRTAAL